LGGYNAKPIFEAMRNLRKRKVIDEDRIFAVHDTARPVTEKRHCFPKDSCLNGVPTSRLIQVQNAKEEIIISHASYSSGPKKKTKRRININALLGP
jgi:hypothetical protein